MAATVKKSFDSPEETRSVDKGTVEILNLEGMQVMRATFQPGWKWSESVKPVAGTQSCEVAHLVYVISGRMALKMDDGSGAATWSRYLRGTTPGSSATSLSSALTSRAAAATRSRRAEP